MRADSATRRVWTAQDQEKMTRGSAAVNRASGTWLEAIRVVNSTRGVYHRAANAVRASHGAPCLPDAQGCSSARVTISRTSLLSSVLAATRAIASRAALR